MAKTVIAPADRVKCRELRRGRRGWTVPWVFFPIETGSWSLGRWLVLPVMFFHHLGLSEETFGHGVDGRCTGSSRFLKNRPP